MTNEQKNQVAAMNASGMSVDEIVLDTGLDKQTVADFVAERNAKNGKRTALTPEIVAQVEDLTRKGWTITDIKAKVGVSPASISRIRTNMKTEKEPAAVATATDSNKDLHENPPISKDTTFSVECQALEAARKKLLAIYETLTPEETRAWELGEVYAEVVRGLGE